MKSLKISIWKIYKKGEQDEKRKKDNFLWRWNLKRNTIIVYLNSYILFWFYFNLFSLIWFFKNHLDNKEICDHSHITCHMT